MRVRAELEFDVPVPVTVTTGGEANRRASLVQGPAIVDDVLYVDGRRVGAVQSFEWDAGDAVFVDADLSGFTGPRRLRVRGWIDLPLPNAR